MSFSVPLTSFFNDVKICVTSYFIYGVSHEGEILYFQLNISEKSSNISRKLLSLSIGVTKVNFMWCVFHNVQWYWSDNLCKLVTDQWRGSLGVRDSESCWLTEEISTYMCWWESPGDLFDVIEEWRQRYGKGHLEIRKNENKKTNIFNTVGVCIWKKPMVKSVIHLLFSYQSVYKMYIMWHSRLRIYI
jgi:hypothetical protein